MHTKEKEILILQKHLSSIRKIAGWTMAELGNKIGVTKQTISNLENNKTQMSLTQYIAIRTNIDYEIENNKENEVLAKVVEILLNRNEEFTAKEREKISGSVEAIAATAAGGIKGPNLNAVGKSLLEKQVAYGAVVVAASLIWLSKFLQDPDKDK